MTALARLRPLCHLNLDFLRAYQITAGDAETCGRHLFDGGTPVAAAAGGIQTFIALAALARIGFSMKMVHGDGQRLMGFLGDGTV